MEFLEGAIKAIPQAATHPFAFIAYLFLIVSWTAIAFRVQRNAKLMDHLEKLPEEDRLPALKAEMGSVTVRGGISAKEWLLHRRQTFYFMGFLALVAAAILVFVIAVNQFRIEESRSELAGILDDRGATLLSQLDALIEEIPGPEVAAFDGQAESYYKSLKETLVGVRGDASSLIEKLRDSLQNGDLVRAHELGNELNKLVERIEPLVSQSDQRAKSLQDLIDILSKMNPTEMSIAMQVLEAEKLRKSKIEMLIENSKKMDRRSFNK